MVSRYTKHYYVGSERIASTLGTIHWLGLFPHKGKSLLSNLNTVSTSEIRSLADDKVDNAHDVLADIYTHWDTQFDMQQAFTHTSTEHKELNMPSLKHIVSYPFLLPM